MPARYMTRFSRLQGARSSLRLISLSSALLLLPACASAPLSCPPPKTIEVPVHKPLDPALVRDCLLDTTHTLPQSGPLTGAALDSYNIALEDAYMRCRAELEELRRTEKP